MHEGSNLVARTRPEPSHSTEDLGRLWGLVHDLGQGLGALSLLIDAIGDDPELSTEARRRLDLAEQELSRLIGIATLPAEEPVFETIDVREVLESLVSLTALSGRTTITLRPGVDVALCTDRTLLWRMVANLVDNAARAAGPDGTVEVAVGTGPDVTIEVIDDGPGFGGGPAGMASLGLGIVTELARCCGAHLRVCPAEHGGTHALLSFPRAGQLGNM
ncbi:histidine kinase/DNA gyrase B/HSP90-like ATPase [Halopolyspora algeriensis]|uniref:histidine kinase n=1 Tax=Halopolyspora algeriensis TaxID=1500506 RepID=A0A368VW62_9ACTN|nr:ATP-binding protein [Halopolyspora algeriensis]RCW44417.1 histidine kinase/DNA gyrase B/HSP90-like ATPase [Halopolyspora algeriensis]TQM55778.1 histidine kinase/DNA gyrase B/HSP90-like ATPase [Halopolyspora algeriensis]